MNERESAADADTSSSHSLPDVVRSDEPSLSLNTTYLAIAAAGVVGLAIGAMVIRRRSRAGSFPAVERAIDLARTGSVRTFSSLKKRLRDEGLAPSQIEGRAKRYIGELLQAGADRLR